MPANQAGNGISHLPIQYPDHKTEGVQLVPRAYNPVKAITVSTISESSPQFSSFDSPHNYFISKKECCEL